MPLFEMLGTAAVKALPLAWTHAPVDAKRQILARVRDINPFASLPNNDNLRRAARLAWIAAALEIVKAAQDADQNPDWTPAENVEHQRFGTVARAALIALRDKAYDRKTSLAASPIDAHVTSLTLGVAEPIESRATEQAAHAHQSLTAAFRDTLRAVTGEEAVPDPVARVAVDGIPVAGDDGATVRRGFGELVFNEFARLLCDPTAFPEGREALRTLTGQWSLSVAQQTLALVEADGARLGMTLDELSARVKQDLDGSLGLLVRIDETVGRVDGKLDTHTAKLNHALALLERVVAHTPQSGKITLAVVVLIAVIGWGVLVLHDATTSQSAAVEPVVKRTEEKIDAISEALKRQVALAEADGAVKRAEAAGFTKAVVVALIERMDREGVQGEKLIPWLDSAIDYMRDRKPKATGDAAFDALIAEAARLFNEGRLEAPAALFKAERERIKKESTDHQRRLLLQEIHYNEAAINPTAVVENLRELAALDGVTGADALGNWLLAKAYEYDERGDQKGDNTALLIAIAAYQDTLKEHTRERAPLDWAATQNNLGIALKTLGARESGTARLEQAVDAYRNALEERPRERAPLQWAATQNNLGNALSTLGAHESGTARLEQAVVAYRNALAEYTRERAPLDWATTQNNLGIALKTLGARESGTARLEQAVDAYRNALEERTRERVPLNWAMTQNNLGNVLWTLGARESGTARLEQAVDAYRNALAEYTRERAPLQWAMTQNNLGTALRTLGARESGTARLEQAVGAFRNALAERTRERVPLQWATTQNNLGTALWTLGERESGMARLEQAVDAYRNALEERTRERVPLDWGASFGNQGVALMILAERRGDGALAERALRQITEAHGLFEEAGHVHAAYYAPQMEQARALVARLRGGG